MKYADGMGSSTVIYITKFHKDWFRQSKFDIGDTQMHRQHGDRISLY
jgi:hypothetical protein